MVIFGEALFWYGAISNKYPRSVSHIGEIMIPRSRGIRTMARGTKGSRKDQFWRENELHSGGVDATVQSMVDPTQTESMHIHPGLGDRQLALTRDTVPRQCATALVTVSQVTEFTQHGDASDLLIGNEPRSHAECATQALCCLGPAFAQHQQTHFPLFLITSIPRGISRNN